jgi:N-acylneuraminate cytidylyltransferase
MNIAVIPARGGSKRIPKKNIKDFLGKPIIFYPIKAAIESRLFDKVIVSTDDNEIKKIAEDFGAVVPFIRPDELSDDVTGTVAVTRHAVQWCIDNGYVLEYVCCIYPTSPLIQLDYLKKGYELLRGSNKLFAFSVTSFSYPIQRALRIENNNIEMYYPENYFSRSQDLEESYHDAGQFYWGTANAFLDQKNLFSDTSIPIILPRYIVQDIDTLEDWDRAELMYKVLYRQ